MATNTTATTASPLPFNLPESLRRSTQKPFAPRKKDNPPRSARPKMTRRVRNEIHRSVLKSRANNRPRAHSFGGGCSRGRPPRALKTPLTLKVKAARAPAGTSVTREALPGGGSGLHTFLMGRFRRPAYAPLARAAWTPGYLRGPRCISPARGRLRLQTGRAGRPKGRERPSPRSDCSRGFGRVYTRTSRRCRGE